MRILVISQYYFPEQFKVNDICESLVESGHSVTVLTGLPNYPKGMIFTDYKNGMKRNEVIQGVKVIRSFLIGRGHGPVKLALNYMSFMFSSSFKVLSLKDQYDIVFVYQLSPILMAIAGLIYKAMHKTPLYLYCLDIWPESLKIFIKNESSILYRIVRRISRVIYSKCDMIGVTSKPFIGYLREIHDIDNNRIVYLPQHGYEIFSKNDLTITVHDGINIGYFGNVGKAQDFNCILNNINAFKDDVKFHIVGDGSEMENLKAVVENKNLQNRIILHGYKSKDGLVNLYKIMDICFLTLKTDSSIGQTLPSKMIEYLSVKKPIVAVASGFIEAILLEAKCGYCVNPGDSNDLVTKVNILSSNLRLRNEFGQNGRTYFDKHFTKKQFISSLEKQLSDLIAQ